MTINTPISIDSDREALLDSQAQYLETYRKALEGELTRFSNRAIDRWLKDTDKAFRDALKLAIDQVTQEAASELARALGDSASSGSFGSSFLSSNGGSGTSQLSNTIANVVVALVNDAFSNEKTTVTSRETERSQQAVDAFRQSRSQQQAAAAKEAVSGQRNL